MILEALKSNENKSDNLTGFILFGGKTVSCLKGAYVRGREMI